jgi:hypothetical protein
MSTYVRRLRAAIVVLATGSNCARSQIDDLRVLIQNYANDFQYSDRLRAILCKFPAIQAVRRGKRCEYWN